jgi:hypothetical protein
MGNKLAGITAQAKSETAYYNGAQVGFYKTASALWNDNYVYRQNRAM